MRNFFKIFSILVAIPVLAQTPTRIGTNTVIDAEAPSVKSGATTYVGLSNYIKGIYPAVAGPGITSLGGQTNGTQTFSGDTNIGVVSSSGVHSIAWSNYLALTRGGTGGTNASTARTALGLTIDSDVQSYNSRLKYISTNAYTPNQIVQIDSSTNLTGVAFSSLLPTTYTNVNNASQTISYSGSNVFFNADSGQVAHVIMSTNLYFNVPINLKVGTYVFFLYQDATGGRTALWTNRFKWHNGTAPTLSTNASYTNLISFVCNGTNMVGGTALNVQ